MDDPAKRNKSKMEEILWPFIKFATDLYVLIIYEWFLHLFLLAEESVKKKKKKNDSKGYHPEMKAWISAHVVTVYSVPDCPFH